MTDGAERGRLHLFPVLEVGGHSQHQSGFRTIHREAQIYSPECVGLSVDSPIHNPFLRVPRFLLGELSIPQCAVKMWWQIQGMCSPILLLNISDQAFSLYFDPACIPIVFQKIPLLQKFARVGCYGFQLRNPNSDSLQPDGHPKGVICLWHFYIHHVHSFYSPSPESFQA